MATWKVGSVCSFVSYVDDKGRVFFPGDLLAVAAVEVDGVLTCLNVDYRGRVVSKVWETVFEEEVRLLDLPPIPIKRFPSPWGDCDNEEDDLTVIWTGCRVGTA